MSEPLRFSDLPDPWSRRADLGEAAHECRAVHERLLAKLGARLDELHGEPYGARSWLIALGPWLLYHLQQLEDRRRRAAARPAGPKPVLLDEADFATPRDTADFLSLFPTERYNLQLLTLCFRALGVAHETARLTADAPYRPHPPSGLALLKRRVRHYACTAARRLWTADVLTDGVYPLGRRHSELAKALDYKAWPLTGELPDSLRPEAVMDERRRSLAALPAEGPLETLAVSTLPWCLPALFLEGLPAARAHARRVLGRTPRLMLHSSGVYYNELYKLCMAEAAAAGAKLVGVQHGGQYGTAEWSNPEWHERRIADRYLTWGWSEDERTRPVPVPWLADAPARRPKPGEVLLVSTTGLKIPHELFAAPIAGQYEEFIAWRERFLAALDPASRAASRVRLFPVDCGWNERPRLEARFPGLAFDSGPLKDSVSRAALVVSDHPGTFFFETLAWDVPGVHFWEDRLWPSRPAALKALEPLRRAGIVHDGPESAARRVAAVRADPAAWWKSPEVAEARRGFAELYARTSPDWAAAWASALRGAAG